MDNNTKNPRRVATGKINGRAKSEAKAAAARINGKRGGKPKGIAITTEHAMKGVAGRMAKLSPERWREIALKAVAAREAKRKESSGK